MDIISVQVRSHRIQRLSSTAFNFFYHTLFVPNEIVVAIYTVKQIHFILIVFDVNDI